MTIPLTGQRVLVVGASGGIGKATADAFEQAGADVSRPDRDALDITDDASVEAFFPRPMPTITWSSQPPGRRLDRWRR